MHCHRVQKYLFTCLFSCSCFLNAGNSSFPRAFSAYVKIRGEKWMEKSVPTLTFHLDIWKWKYKDYPPGKILNETFTLIDELKCM